MDISPVTRKEHFLARAAGDEDALELQPVTREEHLLQNIIDAIEQGGGGGGGGSVTSVNGKTGAVVLSASDVGAAAAETIVTDHESTSITIALAAANTVYDYGELEDLTVTAIPATGDFIIKFDSGSTPTETDFPASLVFPEAFAADADTHYEISVSNGYALVGSWPLS